MSRQLREWLRTHRPENRLQTPARWRIFSALPGAVRFRLPVPLAPFVARHAGGSELGPFASYIEACNAAWIADALEATETAGQATIPP